MKVLMLLAVVGASVAFPQSFLSDTPEVIAEKQRFFQLYNAAAAAAAAAPDDNEITHQASHHSFRAPPQPSTSVWRGPLAATIPAGVAGSLAQVQDTPEVLAARQAFDRAFQEQVRATAPQRTNSIFFSQPTFSHSVPTQPKWTGPLAATIPAGLPGSTPNVRNTPEVEAAIAEFTRAYNSAVRSTSPVHGNSFSNNHVQSSSHHTHFPSTARHNQVHSTSHHFSIPSHTAPVARHQPWVGPLAATIPAGLPGSGPVADTPEVAAAKASFHRTFQQQLSSVHG